MAEHSAFENILQKTGKLTAAASKLNITQIFDVQYFLGVQAKEKFRTGILMLQGMTTYACTKLIICNKCVSTLHGPQFL